MLVKNSKGYLIPREHNIDRYTYLHIGAYFIAKKIDTVGISASYNVATLLGLML